MRRNESARCAAEARHQRNGQGTATKGHHGHYNQHNAKRTEAGTKSYWRSMYGAEAESASRGGINWFSMREAASDDE